jgi:hypothetical protein
MVVDGYNARDPMAMQFKDQRLLYYAATSTAKGGNHTVNVVTSLDLCHWSNKREVFRDSEVGTSGGPTESPFVVARNAKYYLFVCTNHGYNETAVYESDSPFHWDAGNLFGKFPAHAAARCSVLSVSVCAAGLGRNPIRTSSPVSPTIAKKLREAGRGENSGEYVENAYGPEVMGASWPE